MKNNIEIVHFDSLSAHGEQVIHSLLGDNTLPGSYTWPEPDISIVDWQRKQQMETLLARPDKHRSPEHLAFWRFLSGRQPWVWSRRSRV